MFKVIFERDPNKQGNFSMSMLNPFLMFPWVCVTDLPSSGKIDSILE